MFFRRHQLCTTIGFGFAKNNTKTFFACFQHDRSVKSLNDRGKLRFYGDSWKNLSEAMAYSRNEQQNNKWSRQTSLNALKNSSAHHRRKLRGARWLNFAQPREIFRFYSTPPSTSWWRQRAKNWEQKNLNFQFSVFCCAFQLNLIGKQKLRNFVQINEWMFRFR